MFSRCFKNTGITAALVCALCSQTVAAQTIVDVGFEPVYFSNANATRVSGTGAIEGDDNPVGTAFCYTDVFTSGALTVDARVTLEAKSGVTRLEDFDATIWQEKSTPQYFQPNVTWSSATPRRIDFKFEFFDGANVAACAGAPVILRNAYVNTYDLDSSGSGNNTGQGTEFVGIAGYTLASNTELVVEPGALTNSTHIRADTANTSTNNGALPGSVEGDKWRGRVAYAEIPSTGVTIAVTESVGSGLAFYGLDFSEGPVFNNAAIYGLVLAGVGTNGEETSETGTQDCFDVTLGAAPNSDVTVAIAGIDATEGTLDQSSLVFTPSNWSTAQSVCVTGVNDADLDDDISYSLTLTSTSDDLGFSGRTAIVAVTNIDDEGTTSFSINDVTVNEGAGTLTFTVTRTGDAAGAATLNYALSSGTATGSADFNADGGAVSFTDGQATATITVSITNDALYERSESFTVTLSDASVGTIADATGIGTILDDGTGDGGVDNDAPSFSINDVSALESTGELIFTVTKTGATPFDASVSFGMLDGTASGTAVFDQLSAFDYLQASGQLTFAPSETEKTITVTVYVDALFEGSETMQVLLANPVDASITDGTGIGTINDTPATAVPTMSVWLQIFMMTLLGLIAAVRFRQQSA